MNNNARKKIALIFGGPSTEHDVSIASANMVNEVIDRAAYEVEMIKIDRNKKWQFSSRSTKLSTGPALKQLLELRFDFALIVMHGEYGEDGGLQAELKKIRLPFTGSDPKPSANAMDKLRANQIFSKNKLLVAPFIVVNKRDKSIPVKLPAVVKPVVGGSSIGVAIVKTEHDLKQAISKLFKITDRIMIQDFIAGREFTCGVLEVNKKPVVLTPTEIIPKASFFDYNSKYKVDGSNEITPPDLPHKLIAQLQRLALKAHKSLKCRGMSRSDFILSGGKFYILETNTIPGLTKTSLLPQGARASGIDFKQLITNIIKSAHA